jgi:hypothetical protein
VAAMMPFQIGAILVLALLAPERSPDDGAE